MPSQTTAAPSHPCLRNRHDLRAARRGRSRQTPPDRGSAAVCRRRFSGTSPPRRPRMSGRWPPTSTVTDDRPVVLTPRTRTVCRYDVPLSPAGFGSRAAQVVLDVAGGQAEAGRIQGAPAQFVGRDVGQPFLQVVPVDRTDAPAGRGRQRDDARPGSRRHTYGSGPRRRFMTAPSEVTIALACQDGRLRVRFLPEFPAGCVCARRAPRAFDPLLPHLGES